jgi:hypothetical protein
VAGFAAVRQQAQRYPMQVLNAVNAVLFQRHGYSACNRYAPCCCCLLAESSSCLCRAACDLPALLAGCNAPGKQQAAAASCTCLCTSRC